MASCAARVRILTTSFDGLLTPGHVENAPRSGTSDVAVGRIKRSRILGAVEPWHGNEVVVYTPDKAGWA